MASFEHGPSARAWERPRSGHCLTAHDPSAPERRTRKQFLPIAYFMANSLGLSAAVRAQTCRGEKSFQTALRGKEFHQSHISWRTVSRTRDLLSTVIPLPEVRL